MLTAMYSSFYTERFLIVILSNVDKAFLSHCVLVKATEGVAMQLWLAYLKMEIHQ